MKFFLAIALSALYSASSHAEFVFLIRAQLLSYSDTHVTLEEVSSKRKLRLPIKDVVAQDETELSRQLNHKSRIYRLHMTDDTAPKVFAGFKGTTVLSDPLPPAEEKTVAKKK